MKNKKKRKHSNIPLIDISTCNDRIYVNVAMVANGRLYHQVHEIVMDKKVDKPDILIDDKIWAWVYDEINRDRDCIKRDYEYIQSSGINKEEV
jgi:hypothetical protein